MAAYRAAPSLHNLLSTTMLTALVGFGTALTLSAPVMAQQVVNGGPGVTVDVSGITPTSNDVSVLVVENGSVITGNGFDFQMNNAVDIVNTGTCGQAGSAMRCTVIIRDGSQGTLNGRIEAVHSGNTGLAAALWVGENSNVAGSNLLISGGRSYALIATLGSTVTLYGGGIGSTGDGAHAIFVDAVPDGGVATVGGAHVEVTLGGIGSNGAGANGVRVDSYDGAGADTLTQQQSASAELNSLWVVTTGANGDGLRAGGTWSRIDGNDITVQTQGVEAHGVTAVDGAEVYLVDTDVQTLAEGAFGLNSIERGVDGIPSSIQAERARIRTLGNDSRGVSATLGGSITLNNAEILTAGDDASGAFSGRNGSVILTDVMLVTGLDLGMVNGSVVPLDANGNPAATAGDFVRSATGVAAHGLHVIDNGVIGTINSDIRTMGDDSAAVFAGFEAGGTSVAIVEGGSLVSDYSDLIRAEDGDVNVYLRSVGVTSNLNGNVVNAINSQIDARFIDTRGLVGDVVADATSTVNIMLLNNAQLRGASLGANDWSVDGTSRWLIDDNSNVRNLTRNSGLIAFTAPVGGTFKQLTTQYYEGNNGILGLNTYLGGDNSPTDILVVAEDTSGTTGVVVTNAGGPGAQTTGDGIMVVRVDGNSSGQFALAAPAVGGAYSYGLFRGGLADPNDGDWYLRSVGYNPSTTEYETYPQTLLALGALNSLPTFQQRVGNRYWYQPAAPAETVFCKDPAKNFRCEVSQDQASYYEGGAGRPHIDDSAFWTRIEGTRGHFEPESSTVGAGYDLSLFKAQVGVDGLLLDAGNGRLIGGINAYYGTMNSDLWSGIDRGAIDTDGYGVGATLTWMGENGFYVDSQAQVSWFDSDLTSATLGSLVDGNNGMGYAASIEAGQKLALDQHWSITPQAQLVYSKVDFDRFTDAYGARVSLDNGDSLRGRLGLATEYQNSWKGEGGDVQRFHLHGIANVHYEFLDGTQVDVSGVKFNSRNDRIWGGLGVGATYAWNDDKFALYGEVEVNTSLKNFGDSNSVSGTAGFRVKW